MKLSNVIASKDEAWVDYEDGAKFLLVYSQSKGPENFQDKQVNKLRRNTHAGIIPEAKNKELLLDKLVKTVVKGWEGWTDEVDGKEVEYPYSEANCRAMLTRSPVIRDWVASQAANIENFGGNLNPSLDTGEDTAHGKMKSEPPVAAST